MFIKSKVSLLALLAIVLVFVHEIVLGHHQFLQIYQKSAVMRLALAMGI